MADETTGVTDHNANLVTAVQEQTEQARAALAALKTHSNAVHDGSTVQTAIHSFGKVIDKLGEALDLHKQRTAVAEPTGITASEPATEQQAEPSAKATTPAEEGNEEEKEPEAQEEE